MNTDAVVLAGGRGARLGGLDKGAVVIAGSTMLDRALAAVADCATIVVGPEPTRTDGASRAVWVREEPPHSGPAAALATGLEALQASGAPAPLTLVVAVDLLRVRPAVAALRAGAMALGDGGAGDVDAWIAVDPVGRLQPLLAMYRTESLRSACRALAVARGTLEDASMRALVERLVVREIPLDQTLTADVDTPEQLRAALTLAETVEGAR